MLIVRFCVVDVAGVGGEEVIIVIVRWMEHGGKCVQARGRDWARWKARVFVCVVQRFHFKIGIRRAWIVAVNDVVAVSEGNEGSEEAGGGSGVAGEEGGMGGGDEYSRDAHACIDCGERSA